jgi:hypothetical protein
MVSKKEYLGWWHDEPVIPTVHRDSRDFMRSKGVAQGKEEGKMEEEMEEEKRRGDEGSVNDFMKKRKVRGTIVLLAIRKDTRF